MVLDGGDAKFKKSIDALKTELEEKNREIKSLNQAIEDSNRRVLSLESSIKKLESKLVDKHAKPPQAMREESLTLGGLDQVQLLKDEIFHM
jgi:predicted  nucleic acid-binding Zn-ribbon protein